MESLQWNVGSREFTGTGLPDASGDRTVRSAGVYPVSGRNVGITTPFGAEAGP